MESEERFHALFSKYESRLRAFIHARCRNRRRVDPDDVLQELRLKLWQALQRETARLYLQGYGSAEIARLTGWTEPRARNLLYRGLADLRGLMEVDHE